MWYLEEVDLYEILCPYKYANHVKHNPLPSYHKGEFVFLPQEPANDIYLLAKGKVKLGYYDDDGNEFIKAYLGQGEIFGEMAFLGQNKHRDFAEIVEEGTQVCKMSVEKARELGRDYVPFTFEIQKKIGENMRKLERRIEILFCKDAKKRLSELLVDLYNAYSKHFHDKIVVEHHLTQQEMASLIGTSRKTASLLINEFEREGVLKQEWGRFVVLDKAFFERN
jgi:CRP/FNR family transcriptional regulator, cyclic AMP receptor protein